METLLAIAIGVIVAASVYLFLSRDLPRMLLGFILLGTGANLLLLLSGRVGSIMPALIDTADGVLADGAANSLPQALILTAIVIGFGLAAFTLMLALQAYRRFHTLDAESLTAAEFIDPAVLPETEDTQPPLVKHAIHSASPLQNTSYQARHDDSSNAHPSSAHLPQTTANNAKRAAPGAEARPVPVTVGNSPTAPHSSSA